MLCIEVLHFIVYSKRSVFRIGIFIWKFHELLFSDNVDPRGFDELQSLPSRSPSPTAGAVRHRDSPPENRESMELGSSAANHGHHHHHHHHHQEDTEDIELNKVVTTCH